MRTSEITIEDRGNPLVFRLTQMSAWDLEAWTYQAGLILAAAGSDIPANRGLDGVLQYLKEHGFGALGSVDYNKAKPLMDDMLKKCCVFVNGNMTTPVDAEHSALIQDMSTLFKLRLEVFKINFDFFGRGGKSASPEEPNTIKLNAR